MDQLNINKLLDRSEQEKKLYEYLNYFEENKQKMEVRRGIYVYGSPGTGKTEFVTKILKKMNYDILKYDAGDVRNKNVIEEITKNNMSDKNIINLFLNKVKKIAIIMDEIDGLNSGDKGGINTLIKLIRPKKTKKQKKENITMIPIICIGDYHIDKKIKEMMKVCVTIELKSPTTAQLETIINLLMPKLDPVLLNNMRPYITGDLRKIKAIYQIYKNQQSILKNKIITNMFQPKIKNEDTKHITKKLLNNKYTISQHQMLMNETDRTSVGLLFHENVIDIISKIDINLGIPFYIKLLRNITFSDYIDRITFQKQIWVFNEMSSLIKTLYNNHLYNEKFGHLNLKFNPPVVRFTKVLTKYSTEYNNILFIQNLCRQLNMDKKDMLSYFLYLRTKYNDEDIYELFNNENYDISKLDINRIYRFINNYTNTDL